MEYELYIDYYNGRWHWAGIGLALGWHWAVLRVNAEHGEEALDESENGYATEEEAQEEGMFYFEEFLTKND